MKTILLRGNNDRGNEFRASTNRETLPLDVFFKSGKAIRKAKIEFVTSETGELVIVVEGQELRAAGMAAEKLAFKA